MVGGWAAVKSESSCGGNGSNLGIKTRLQWTWVHAGVWSSALCQGHGVIAPMSQTSWNSSKFKIKKLSPNALSLYFPILFTSVQFIIIHFSTMCFIGMAVENEMPKHQDKRSTFSLSAGLIRSTLSLYHAHTCTKNSLSVHLSVS